MSQDINVRQISAGAKKSIRKLKVYASFLTVIAILLIYSFLVFRVSTLSQAEPDEATVAEKSNTIRRLKIDQNAVEKLEELEDQNIGVQSLFEEARDNPFQD